MDIDTASNRLDQLRNLTKWAARDGADLSGRNVHDPDAYAAKAARAAQRLSSLPQNVTDRVDALAAVDIGQ